jgi:hypothetical protein
VGRSDGRPWGDLVAISGDFRWPPVGRFPWPPSPSGASSRSMVFNGLPGHELRRSLHASPDSPPAHAIYEVTPTDPRAATGDTANPGQAQKVDRRRESQSAAARETNRRAGRHRPPPLQVLTEARSRSAGGASGSPAVGATRHRGQALPGAIITRDPSDAVAASRTSKRGRPAATTST